MKQDCRQFRGMSSGSKNTFFFGTNDSDSFFVSNFFFPNYTYSTEGEGRSESDADRSRIPFNEHKKLES